MFTIITISMVGLLGALFIFAVIMSSFVDDKYGNLPDDTPTIRLDELKKIYLINPDKWCLYQGWVSYRDNEYYSTDIRIHLLDLIPYSIWKNNLTKNHHTIRQINKLQFVLNDIKKDIARFEEENKKRTEEELQKLWAHKNN